MNKQVIRGEIEMASKCARETCTLASNEQIAKGAVFVLWDKD